ncbi:TM1266 family iron-only hydrogenase system putative regulator [Thermodesulfitimonas sp.]
MESRIGVIGIIVENRREAAPRVNEILSRHADIIVGRMGVPYREKNLSVITLIVDGTTDALGALTGQLGALPGVKVKSALARRLSGEDPQRKGSAR